MTGKRSLLMPSLYLVSGSCVCRNTNCYCKSRWHTRERPLDKTRLRHWIVNCVVGKTPLPMLLGRAFLNFDELQNFLTEVDATINSKRLKYLDEEGTDREQWRSCAVELRGKRIVKRPVQLLNNLELNNVWNWMTWITCSEFRKFLRNALNLMMDSWNFSKLVPYQANECSCGA